MKQKIEIEVEIPEGWKFVRHGCPKQGEWFLCFGRLEKALGDFVSEEYVIVEKDNTIAADDMKDGDIGVIVEWEGYSSRKDTVVQRYYDNLVAIGKRGGQCWSGFFKLGRNDRLRVRLLDQEKVKEVLRGLE